jgi:hypothetical protein
MKLSKKFAGALLLGLTMVTIAAVPASAALLQVRGDGSGDLGWGYDINAEYTARLYKEVNDDCEPWRVVPSDTLITMRKLKYNAEIAHVRVSGQSKQKITVLPKRAGQYYLRFKANQYIRPGDKVRISYVVYQQESAAKNPKRAYNVTEVITFKKIKATDIFRKLEIEGADVRGNFDANFLDDDDIGWDGREKISIKTDKDLATLKRIYAVDSKGRTTRVYNGDRPNFDKIDHLIVRVELAEPEFYKRNDCVAGDCGKVSRMFDFIIYNN